MVLKRAVSTKTKACQSTLDRSVEPPPKMARYDLQEPDSRARVHELLDDLGAALVKVVQRDARHRALVVGLEAHCGVRWGSA